MAVDQDKLPSTTGNLPEAASSAEPPARLLQVWLILLTIAAFGTCFLIGAGALLLGSLSLYFLDSPDFSTGNFITLQVVLWVGTIFMAALLILGVTGGWRAYRQKRVRRALALSLLALVPIGLCLCTIVIALLTSSSPFPITLTVSP